MRRASRRRPLALSPPSMLTMTDTIMITTTITTTMATTTPVTTTTEKPKLTTEGMARLNPMAHDMKAQNANTLRDQLAGISSRTDAPRVLNYLVPTVVEQTTRGERAYDLFSRMLREHI